MVCSAWQCSKTDWIKTYFGPRHSKSDFRIPQFTKKLAWHIIKVTKSVIPDEKSLPPGDHISPVVPLIYPVTYHTSPGQSMNSYVSDPCLVWQKNWPLIEEVGLGGVIVAIACAILVPGSNPQNLETIFLANLANFHVATIIAISTYIKPNIWLGK